MDFKRIVALILLISAVEYFVTFARRKLIVKHDDRFILLLEVLLIFLFTAVIVLSFTSKKDLKQAFAKFTRDDYVTIGLSSLFTVIVTILWVVVIDEDELSKIQFLSTGLDLFIALAGGYILLREGITVKKVSAFVLLIASVYLLSS